jgi:predicted transposase YdaD
LHERVSFYNVEIEKSKSLIRKYTLLEHNRGEILKAQKQIEGYLTLKGSNDQKSSIIMSKIESEARKSKLQILDLNSIGSSKIKGSIWVHRINLRAEGQIKDILDFISAIEEADILLQVEKLNLSGKDDSGSILKIEAVIFGVSFK